MNEIEKDWRDKRDLKILFVAIMMLIIWSIMGIFLIYGVGAQEIQTLGEFVYGKDINLIQNCGECSYVNISNIYDDRGRTLISEVEMYKNGSLFNYTFSSSDYSDYGRYIVVGYGDAEEGSDEMVGFAYDFFIIRNPDGYFGIDFDDTLSIVMIVIFFIIGVMMLMFKSYVWSSIIFLIGGMLLLFNGFNIAISVTIVFLGFIIMFANSKKS